MSPPPGPRQPPPRRLLQRSPPWQRLQSLAPLVPVHLLQWRQVEQEMADLGRNRLRLVLKQNSGRLDPPKHPHSQSRRWEAVPMLPFPLLDSEGRHSLVMKLYDYAAEQTPLLDVVAGNAIRHLHTHLLPCEARSLRNQVVCMIAECHSWPLVQRGRGMVPV